MRKRLKKYRRNMILYAQPGMKIKRKNNYYAHIQAVDRV